MNKTLIVIAVALSITGVARAAPRTPCLPMQPCPMADIRWLAVDPGTYAIFRRAYQAYAARPDVMESLRKIQVQIDALHAQADAEKVARQVAKQKTDQDAAAERKRLDAAMRANPVAFQAAIDAKNAASQAAYQAKYAKAAPAQPSKVATTQPIVARNFDIDEDIRRSYAGQFGGGAGAQEVKKEAPATTLTGHYRADGLMVSMQRAEELVKKQDYNAALELIRPLADKGIAEAQLDLGKMYENGQAVTKDDVQAVIWYRRAADQGNAEAQLNLGWAYGSGQGVAKDDAQAVGWFRKAAEQGNASAQNDIAYMYSEGKGVTKDAVQAVAWYRKAAEQGNVSAQKNLAGMYAVGQGVEKDDAKVVYWYNRAKAQENAASAAVAVPSVPM